MLAQGAPAWQGCASLPACGRNKRGTEQSSHSVGKWAHQTLRLRGMYKRKEDHTSEWCRQLDR